MEQVRHKQNQQEAHQTFLANQVKGEFSHRSHYSAHL